MQSSSLTVDHVGVAREGVSEKQGPAQGSVLGDFDSLRNPVSTLMLAIVDLQLGPSCGESSYIAVAIADEVLAPALLGLDRGQIAVTSGEREGLSVNGVFAVVDDGSLAGVGGTEHGGGGENEGLHDV